MRRYATIRSNKMNPDEQEKSTMDIVIADPGKAYTRSFNFGIQMQQIQARQAETNKQNALQELWAQHGNDLMAGTLSSCKLSDDPILLHPGRGDDRSRHEDIGDDPDCVWSGRMGGAAVCLGGGLAGSVEVEGRQRHPRAPSIPALLSVQLDEL